MVNANHTTQEKRSRIWMLGDDIDTDRIIATQFLVLRDIKVMASHALETVDPEFASVVKPNDVIVAGKNFGCGSSREQAPKVLKCLGIGFIIADSVARIFFRNCINLGLPVIECPGIRHYVGPDDLLEMDYESGKVHRNGEPLGLEYSPLVPFMLEILRKGGLVEYTLHLLEQKSRGEK